MHDEETELTQMLPQTNYPWLVNEDDFMDTDISYESQFEYQYVKLVTDGSDDFEVQAEIIPLDLLTQAYYQYQTRIIHLSLIECSLNSNDCEIVATS